MPEHISDIVSQVITSFWQEHLQHHWDCHIANFILSGLAKDSPKGFEASSRLKAASSNLILAREHPEVVSAYTVMWLTGSCRFIRGYEQTDHITESPMLVLTPKKANLANGTLSWISSPQKDLVSMTVSQRWHHASMDLTVEQISQLGPGTLMAKMGAYRNISIPPSRLV